MRRLLTIRALEDFYLGTVKHDEGSTYEIIEPTAEVLVRQGKAVEVKPDGTVRRRPGRPRRVKAESAPEDRAPAQGAEAEADAVNPEPAPGRYRDRRLVTGDS